MKKFVPTLALALLPFTSCAPYATNVIGYGNYWYVLPQPAKEHYRIGDHGMYWETRKWTLKVDEYQHIYFNGHRLQQMQKGDELRVTWEGDIYLNNDCITPADGP